ncbi:MULTISPECIES: methyltransferase [unclassified Mesorhizobium]|uniref:methyltransferase n=1 Tax=unclassified Mesorhizobium TaxID=325217 RepID=UPI001677E98D|nr:MULTISPECIES: methyltransferase [unclassified Mesorhizobium]
MNRIDELRRNLDKETMSGVEIGPFYSPIVPKNAGWKTTVIDFQDGAALRAAARSHAAASIRQSEDQIEDVDIVWQGEPLDDLALARRPEGYDYFVASHVIEHTPDLISFLQQIERLLRPGGIVSMAVPDMRKCFDMYKPVSGLREVLTAYREKRTRHTPETLLEARALSVNRNGAGAWLAGSDAPLTFAGNFDHAWQSYPDDVKGRDGSYVDAHAWFFTPASFKLLVLELGYMGLLNLDIDSVVESRGAEFIVQMRVAPVREKLSLAEFNEQRLALSQQQIEEVAAELVPQRVVEVPVPVQVQIPPPVQSTREVARLLANRMKRKALSVLHMA